MFNQVTSTCFDRCVKSFKSRVLDESEQACLLACANKSVRTTKRVGLRFQEANSALGAGLPGSA
jgi:import inner membrane translocase subunit TIM9